MPPLSRSTRIALCVTGVSLLGFRPVRADPPADAEPVTLERIMSDPDWIGHPPERPYWADDGESFYFFQKRSDGTGTDLVRVRLSDGQSLVVPDAERGRVDAPGGVYSSDRRLKTFARNGDVFVKDIASGTTRQLTRTAAVESDPRFMLGDDRIVYRRGPSLFMRGLFDGLEVQPADLRTRDDPDDAKPDEPDYLKEQQSRLFPHVSERKTREDAMKQRARASWDADPTRPPRPWYLGANVRILQTHLSPDGRWMLVTTASAKRERGKADTMASYVTDTGYATTRNVRPKVGTGDPEDQHLLLLDLAEHALHRLDLSVLPGITDDPLHALREAARLRRSRATRGVDEAQRTEESTAPPTLDASRDGNTADLERATTRTTDRTTNPTTDRTTNQTTNQTTNRTTNQTTNETTNQTTNRTTNQTTNETTNQTTNETTNRTTDPITRQTTHRTTGGAHETAAGDGATDPVFDARPKTANDATPPKPRPVSIRSVQWNADGSRVVFQCLSSDHKDRWIATIDLDRAVVVPREHMTDAAWINERFVTLGWLRDGHTIYFISEEDGYAHLYVHDLAGGSRRQLTRGHYEVSSARLSHDDRFFTFRANAREPTIYDIYRVGIEDGRVDQLTDMGGTCSARLSPDESRLLMTCSTSTRPPELYVQDARAGAPARQMTRAVSDAFTSVAWVRPEIVAIPSSSGGKIYAKVYLPPGPPNTPNTPNTPNKPDAPGTPDAPDADPAPGTAPAGRPGVVFVHGAGYLQNANNGWSYYFREFMFHTLLARRGCVVLDMDYRASSGYGRDWRAAIYRHMGGPELEDLRDGVKWMVEHHGVDPKRVGIYGGSYGGFLTLMALFQEPDLFACGAALRPVTDWAHYGDDYTSAILNTPRVDPESYERSSPIEFAEGLSKPLLICHGMLDDNVLFEDTVRLAQRLIELEKRDWEVAIFPIEAHSFHHPSSWLNEYRRILKLFETHLGL